MNILWVYIDMYMYLFCVVLGEFPGVSGTILTGEVRGRWPGIHQLPGEGRKGHLGSSRCLLYGKIISLV